MPQSGHLSLPPPPPSPSSLLPFSLNNCNLASHSCPCQPVPSHLSNTLLCRTHMDYVPSFAYPPWLLQHTPATNTAYKPCGCGGRLPRGSHVTPLSPPLAAADFSHTVISRPFQKKQWLQLFERRHKTRISLEIHILLDFWGTLYNSLATELMASNLETLHLQR